MSDIFSVSQLLLERAPDGTLRAQVEGDRCALNVQILRALPLSNEEEFLSIRDGSGRELILLESLNDVPEPTKSLICASLNERYFLPKILKILSITERFGSADWQVETDRGRTLIQTKAIHEALIEIETNRYLLRDNEDNRFDIPDASQLDPASQLRLMGKY